MNRIQLIQEIFDTTNFKTYLEIGSQRGTSLFPIKCKNKIAIDPQFIIKTGRKIKWWFRNPVNFNIKYFEETSDDFFAKRKDFLKKKNPIDIALVDGLHTFRAALQDVLNTLPYLNPKGLIVMHDCFPPNEVAATPSEEIEKMKDEQPEGFTGEWCGDVWKAIVYLKENHSDVLDVCVLNTDYGLGIVRIKDEGIGELSIVESNYKKTDTMTYKDMMINPQEIINFKEEAYAATIIKETERKQ